MDVYPIANLDALKDQLKSTWMAGDFGQVAKFIESHAQEFIARRHVRHGMRVLDVACGTGNLAIPAAKSGAIVTGVDIAPNLITQARARARREGVQVQFDEGDAENLVYPDSCFDLVVSMYGAMFAPRPKCVSAELIRVCRAGGQIAMANWTPRGFVGQMFGIIAGYLPPMLALPSPVLWGHEATVRERLRDGIKELKLTQVLVPLRYPFPVAGTVEFYRTCFGPVQHAFAVLPPEKQRALRRDLEHLFTQHNQATDGATCVEAEYLEIVAGRA